MKYSMHQFAAQKLHHEAVIVIVLHSDKQGVKMTLQLHLSFPKVKVNPRSIQSITSMPEINLHDSENALGNVDLLNLK